MTLFWQNSAGRQYHTSFYGSYTGTFSSSVAVANTIFSSIVTSFTTNLAALQASAYTLQQMTMYDITTATSPVYTTTASGAPGSSASVAMPENAAIVLTTTILGRGRGAKGRMFIPNWATNADGGGGVITGATQTALNAFGLGIFNAITGNGLTPAVARPLRNAYIGYTGTSHPQRPAQPLQVTAYVCRDLVWDTQRRRVQL
jgi:hypothetical protein